MANKGGKPRHVPTDETKKIVAELAATPLDQEQIALRLSICSDTLRKYYSTELKVGLPTIVGKSMGVLNRALDDPDTKIALTAAIFILKTRGRFRETDDKTMEDIQKTLSEVKSKMDSLKEIHDREY